MENSITNKLTGEKIIWLETAEDTNGKYLTFRMILAPEGSLPVIHVHPRQTERFAIKKGVLTLFVNGRDQYVKPGESFTVPKGAPHKFMNESVSDEVEMVVTLTPALNTKTFLEQYYGFANDNRAKFDGTPPFLQLMAWVNEYELFVAGPPLWVQKVLGHILGSLGGWLGYKKFYPNYSSSPSVENSTFV